MNSLVSIHSQPHSSSSSPIHSFPFELALLWNQHVPIRAWTNNDQVDIQVVYAFTRKTQQRNEGEMFCMFHLKECTNLLKSIQQNQFSNNSYYEFNLRNIKCLCEMKEVILKWSQSFMVFHRKDFTQSLRLSDEMSKSALPKPMFHENDVQKVNELSRDFAVLPNLLHSYDHSRSPKEN